MALDVSALSFEDRVSAIFVGYYNRAPAVPGRDAFVADFQNGQSPADVARSFVPQQETLDLYPSINNAQISRADAIQLVTDVFNNLFNRDPSNIGPDNFWVREVLRDGAEVGQIILNIMSGAQGDDLTILQNKIAVGTAYVTAAEAVGDNGTGILKDTILEGVDASRASLLSAFANIESAFPASGSKDDPTDDLTDDADEGDKSAISQVFQEKSYGDQSIDLIDSASVLSLDDFRADPRFSGIDGSGYTVVILDTGIDLDHPAFGPDTDQNGVADRITVAIDFTPETDGTANDLQGHGTHVAGIVGSSDPNFLGVAPNVNFVALQVLNNEDGSGSDRDIEDALQWVAANAAALNIVAVNLSLGDGTNGNSILASRTFGDEFDALRNDLGVAVLVAAGNDYDFYRTEGASTMSRDPNSISVGSTGGTNATRDQISSFSQRSNDIPTIFAPGEGILSARAGGGEVIFSGTSMATPQIAGMVALGQQIAEENLGRRLTMDEIDSLLTGSAFEFTDVERNDDRVPNTGVNYDRVDMLTFAEYILNFENPGDLEPPVNADPIPGNISSTEVISLGQSRVSSVDYAGDQDFFAINLDPGTYAFNLQGAPSGRGTLSDPLLSLHTATGAFISSDDDSGTGLDSSLEYSIQQAGTFFINANAFGSSTGSYTLTVTGDAGIDGEIPNNRSTQSVLDIGTTIQSNIDFGADSDWFRVDLTAGNIYQFDLVGVTLQDPYLVVRDSDEFIVVVDDDGGQGLNSSLTFEATREGTYFIAAEAFATSQTGSYELSAALIAGIADDFTGNTSTSGFINAENGQATGVLEEAGDIDWFRADLSAGTVYTFGLAGDESVGELRDPLLELYDANGFLIARNDDGGEGLNSELQYTPNVAQTVYLSAGGYADAQTGIYVLTSTADGSFADVGGDTSTEGTLVVGQTIDGVIGEPGDVDWYAVGVQAGVQYQFEMNFGSGSNPLNDPFLALFSASGQFITFDDDGGLGLQSQLIYTPDFTGLVYISAEAYDLGTDQGTYSLSLTAEGLISGDIPGDTSTNAIIPFNSSSSGLLEELGDTDWFEIFFFEGERIQIDLVGTGSDPLDDPLVELYDSSGQFLASNDDGGAGLNSQLIYDASYTGSAFVSADAFADGSTGSYEVSFTVLSSGSTLASVELVGTNADTGEFL